MAGKLLAGWLVVDLDGTLITAHSDKEGAAPTFKKSYAFHPLRAWLANTTESLAMLLRPGNAGSNTFADHLAVLTAAIRRIPSRMRCRLLVRVDGTGASHELITHLLSLCTQCRTVLFTCGWMITEDRAPHQAVAAAGQEVDRVRARDRLAVLDHRDEHPRRRHPGVPGSHHAQFIAGAAPRARRR